MHFYTKDGESRHFMPTKPGAKNPTRPTTIADAKKLGLLPSVTGYVDVLSKDELTNWKIEQVLDAAHVNPHNGELRDRWGSRIRELAFRQVSDAADFGERIHAAMDAAMSGREWDRALACHVAPALKTVASLGITECECERSVVNAEAGYAGRCDLFGYRLSSDFGLSVPFVLDYKTIKTKPGKKIEARESHRIQIAAYHVARFGAGLTPHPWMHGANHYISSTEPGRNEVMEWTPADLQRGWEMFLATTVIWRNRHGYDPRTK